MNIKFESQFLMRNFSVLADIINTKIERDYPITKDTENLVSLKENEVVLFKILNSKLERDYKIKYNKKYQHLAEHTVTRTVDNSSELINCDIILTNKYVHLVFEKGTESINLGKIIELFVDPNVLVLYTEDKKYRLTLNNINYILQTVFLIDVLKVTPINDSHVGQTISIDINN